MDERYIARELVDGSDVTVIESRLEELQHV
jgi:hypothetical protein